MKKVQLTKRQLIQRFVSVNEVAVVLKLSHSSVSVWKLDEPIPKKHELRLKHELLPELFGDTPDIEAGLESGKLRVVVNADYFANQRAVA